MKFDGQHDCTGDLFSDYGLGFFENSNKIKKLMQQEDEEINEAFSGVKKKEKLDNQQNLDDLVEKCNAYTKYLRDKIKKAENNGDNNIYKSNYNILCDLFPFQKKGVNWLLQLYEVGVNGILGDEMGLGKTVQIIAMISYLCSVGISRNYLIIGPLSTLINWKNEFQKFAPHISTFIYNNQTRARNKNAMLNIMKNNQVIITSYDYPLMDHKLFHTTIFKLMVIDEGHRLKNHNCSLFHRLHSFKTAHKILLTGTPIMNDTIELWSLLNFLMPEIFCDLNSFKTWFSAKILHKQSLHEAILRSEENDNILKKLHDIIEPFMLRRLKKNLKDSIILPPKKEILIYTPVTQFQHYLTMQLDSMDNKKLEKCTIEPFNGFKASKLSQLKRLTDVKWKYKLLRGQMEHRHLVNHPLLYVWPENQDNVDLSDSLVALSGKMIYFDVLLSQLLLNNHKILVFSQFVMMLNILKDYLDLKGIKYASFDGQTPFNERQEQIDRFNCEKSDYRIFLLSTRSGGLGLNLTSADTVIFYDTDWNPYMDIQAQDRCHRLGQTKPVVIYRLISKNTYDERMFNATIGKYRLAKAILMESDKGNASLLSDNEYISESVKLQDLKQVMGTKIGDLSHIQDEKIIGKFDKKIIDRKILFNGKTLNDEEIIECDMT